MRRTILAVTAIAGCPAPETELVDVHIPVGLQDADQDDGPCENPSAYLATGGVWVEIHQPLGDDPANPIGRCAWERKCVDLADSIGSLQDLQAELRAQGVFFQPMPPYEGVLLHLRGERAADCAEPPAEGPLWCGYSGTLDVATVGGTNVAITCALDRCGPPAVPCAGSDL